MAIGEKSEKKVIFWNQLKKLNFDETFEDRENELDFYGSVNIEIQQQPDDINPFTCELNQTFFNVLDFNPA